MCVGIIVGLSLIIPPPVPSHFIPTPLSSHLSFPLLPHSPSYPSPLSPTHILSRSSVFLLLSLHASLPSHSHLRRLCRLFRRLSIPFPPSNPPTPTHTHTGRRPSHERTLPTQPARVRREPGNAPRGTKSIHLQDTNPSGWSHARARTHTHTHPHPHTHRHIPPGLI